MPMSIGGDSGFHGIGSKIEKKPEKFNSSNVSKMGKNEDAKGLNMGVSEKKADFRSIMQNMGRGSGKYVGRRVFT